MRGKKAPKRDIKPDPEYKSALVGRFINKIMQDGKKDLAQKIVYDTFDAIKNKTKKDPMKIFTKAVEEVKPTVELRSRRVGGANYQVPMPVTQERGEALAIRWIVESARDRKGQSIKQALTNELLDASNGEGAAIKIKENTHRMAEANKAFAIFRW